MLILTKEEVCNRIECFEKLIGVYNKKIEFLQKILVYFEKTGRNVDCLVVNVCIQEIPDGIFTVDDEISLFNGKCEVNNNNQEHRQNITASPLSVVNTSNPINPIPLAFLPKSIVSSEISNNTLNGSHFRHIPSSLNKAARVEKCYTKPLEDGKKNVFIVPKRENALTASSITERMDMTRSLLQDSDIHRQLTTFQTGSGSDQRTAANIFLSETDLETNDVQTLGLSIKNIESLNGSNDRSKDNKIKQFQCDICPSAFAQKGVLNRHRILRHSPIVHKPHVCPNCQKGFTLKHHLKNHLKCKSGCRSNIDFNV